MHARKHARTHARRHARTHARTQARTHARILRYVSSLLLRADVVGKQAEVAVGGDEGEDALRLPALEADAGVEADVVQQPGVLGDTKQQPQVGTRTTRLSGK